MPSRTAKTGDTEILPGNMYARVGGPFVNELHFRSGLDLGSGR